MNKSTVSILFIALFLLSCTFDNNRKSVKTNDAGNLAQAAVIAPPADTLFDFGSFEPGKIPTGWSSHLTGDGPPCHWEIRDDAGEKVLAQTSSETQDYRFNLIVNDDLKFKDVEISVRFKGMKGSGDQGGGPVWRYQDENNYYVARANPLENNYRVYKVVNGRRRQLESASIKMNSNEWYTLKITMQGDVIKCWFDHDLALETTDETFLQEGKIGLWTKSDALTYFDDLHIRSTH